MDGWGVSGITELISGMSQNVKQDRDNLDCLDCGSACPSTGVYPEGLNIDAADMAPRTYSKAPAPMAVAPSWTGFYIFGGAGGGIYDADNYWYNNTTGAPFVVSQKLGGDGWFGTVGAGYDWQFNSSWVAGIFADGQLGSLKGTMSGGFGGVVVSGTEKLRDTWAVGARLGYLIAPNVLSYVNGGYTESYW